MRDKLALLLLFGGVSAEHEVSCVSAASVYEHIDKEKYDIHMVGIDKEGNWRLTDSPSLHVADGRWEKNPDNRPVFIMPGEGGTGRLHIDKESGFRDTVRIDVVFPVLHGKNGEDGTIQGLLEISGIPFVGSRTASSAASMDKAVTKAIVDQAGGIVQAKGFVSHKKEYDRDGEKVKRSITEYFGKCFPLFVKPASSGSSVGISKVDHENGLGGALETAFKEDSKAIVEEAVEGRELEVSVLGNEKPQASCIGEIFAANEFYDYNAKYENDMSRTDIVRDLSPEKEREIRRTALKVYEIMGCRGLARVDFFLKDDGELVFNEINTLPGFTPISMYPKLWIESGIAYDELIDRLVNLALE